MRCALCGARDTRVIETRELEDGAVIRRRHACGTCRGRFTSYERAALPSLCRHCGEPLRHVSTKGRRRAWCNRDACQQARRAFAAEVVRRAVEGA